MGCNCKLTILQGKSLKDIFIIFLLVLISTIDITVLLNTDSHSPDFTNPRNLHLEDSGNGKGMSQGEQLPGVD